MKIPFHIKYKPQIDSGEYVIEDREGNILKLKDIKNGIYYFSVRYDGTNYDTERVYDYPQNHLFLVTKEEIKDEKIRISIIRTIEQCSDILTPANQNRMLAWLEKQKFAEMIQWKGDNLKEVIDFTGKSPKFNDWFKTWEEYETYVNEHNNVFKLFNKDGSHYEVQVGAWIVKTPDGYNVASKATFKQNLIWTSEDEKGLDDALWCCKQASSLAKDENDMGNVWYAEKWLKSIKPQNHWKPSEEQLVAIKFCCANFEEYDALRSLYNDLKTLKYECNV